MLSVRKKISLQSPIHSIWSLRIYALRSRLLQCPLQTTLVHRRRLMMRPPFPGMDTYLEHPALWPDVHNSLIAAIRNALTPKVAPRYYIALERRT